MKKIIYMAFEVEANSYEEGRKKLDEGFGIVETVLENESVNKIPKILKTRKHVKSVKF